MTEILLTKKSTFHYTPELSKEWLKIKIVAFNFNF